MSTEDIPPIVELARQLEVKSEASTSETSLEALSHTKDEIAIRAFITLSITDESTRDTVLGWLSAYQSYHLPPIREALSCATSSYDIIYLVRLGPSHILPTIQLALDAISYDDQSSFAYRRNLVALCRIIEPLEEAEAKRIRGSLKSLANSLGSIRSLQDDLRRIPEVTDPEPNAAGDALCGLDFYRHDPDRFLEVATAPPLSLTHLHADFLRVEFQQKNEDIEGACNGLETVCRRLVDLPKDFTSESNGISSSRSVTTIVGEMLQSFPPHSDSLFQEESFWAFACKKKASIIGMENLRRTLSNHSPLSVQQQGLLCDCTSLTLGYLAKANSRNKAIIADLDFLRLLSRHKRPFDAVEMIKQYPDFVDKEAFKKSLPSWLNEKDIGLLLCKNILLFAKTVPQAYDHPKATNAYVRHMIGPDAKGRLIVCAGTFSCFVEKYGSNEESIAIAYLESVEAKARTTFLDPAIHYDPEAQQAFAESPEYDFITQYAHPIGSDKYATYEHIKGGPPPKSPIDDLENLGREGYPAMIKGRGVWQVKDDEIPDERNIMSVSIRLAHILQRTKGDLDFKDTFYVTATDIAKHHKDFPLQHLRPDRERYPQSILYVLVSGCLLSRTKPDDDYFKTYLWPDALDMLVFYDLQQRGAAEAFHDQWSQSFKPDLDGFDHRDPNQVVPLLSLASQRYGDRILEATRHLLSLEGEDIKPQDKSFFHQCLLAAFPYLEVRDTVPRHFPPAQDVHDKKGRWARGQWKSLRDFVDESPSFFCQKRLDSLCRWVSQMLRKTIPIGPNHEVFPERVRQVLSPLLWDFSWDRFVPLLEEIEDIRAQMLGETPDLWPHLSKPLLDRFGEIQSELSKYENVPDQENPRQIRSFVTCTRETAHARNTCNICVGRDRRMVSNPRTFEIVSYDEETGKCVGTVMLLEMQAADGGTYLAFAPNVSEDFYAQVHPEDMFAHQYEVATQIVDNHHYQGLVIPDEEDEIASHTSNNGDFYVSLLKDKRLMDEEPIIIPDYAIMGSSTSVSIYTEALAKGYIKESFDEIPAEMYDVTGGDGQAEPLRSATDPEGSFYTFYDVRLIYKSMAV